MLAFVATSVGSSSILHPSSTSNFEPSRGTSTMSSSSRAPRSGTGSRVCHDISKLRGTDVQGYIQGPHGVRWPVIARDFGPALQYNVVGLQMARQLGLAVEAPGPDDADVQQPSPTVAIVGDTGRTRRVEPVGVVAVHWWTTPAAIHPPGLGLRMWVVDGTLPGGVVVALGASFRPAMAEALVRPRPWPSILAAAHARTASSLVGACCLALAGIMLAVLWKPSARPAVLRAEPIAPSSVPPATENICTAWYFLRLTTPSRPDLAPDPLTMLSLSSDDPLLSPAQAHLASTPNSPSDRQTRHLIHAAYLRARAPYTHVSGGGGGDGGATAFSALQAGGLGWFGPSSSSSSPDGDGVRGRTQKTADGTALLALTHAAHLLLVPETRAVYLAEFAPGMERAGERAARAVAGAWGAARDETDRRREAARRRARSEWVADECAEAWAWLRRRGGGE